MRSFSGSRLLKEVDWAYGHRCETAAGAQAI
jgi:hypothetical protein